MSDFIQGKADSSLNMASTCLRYLRATQADLTRQAYLLHIPANGEAWTGLGAHRIVNYNNDGYEVFADGHTRQLPVASDVFRGLQDLLDPDYPAYFLISLDLHRPVNDASLPLMTFIQPKVEVFFRDTSPPDIFTTDNAMGALINGCLESIAKKHATQPPVHSPARPIADSKWHGEDDAHFLDRLTSAVETLQSVHGKMILTRTYQKPCPPDADPFHLYEIYSAFESGAAASHYAALGNDTHSIGCSPENVFELSNGRLCFDVVAATRGISQDPVVDARWLDELRTDPKEHKEHNMALERYQRRMQQLCAPHSITLDRHMDVRTLRHVRHLHSRISGALQPPTDFFDMLRGSSPPLCSYPEELISLADPGTEPTRFYGGMVGRLAPGWRDASCYLNLRSVLIKGNNLYTQGGVGVIRESIPRQELLEVSNKLRSLKEAVSIWENAS